MLSGQSGVNSAAPRPVKLSPALPIGLFRETCTIRISGGLVCSCQRTHTPRAAFRLEGRGPAYHTEFSKTLCTIPSYGVYDRITRVLRAPLEPALLLTDVEGHPRFPVPECGWPRPPICSAQANAPAIISVFRGRPRGELSFPGQGPARTLREGSPIRSGLAPWRLRGSTEIAASRPGQDDPVRLRLPMREEQQQVCHSG